MSTLNIDQIHATLSELQTQIKGITDSLATTMVAVDQLKKYETHWDSFLTVEVADILKEFYPQDAQTKTQEILSALKICRRNEDYRFLTPTYKMFNASENLKIRQLLKLISAADRIIHFRNTRAYTNMQLSSLKSELKYAKACPECGSIATKLWDRIIKDSSVTV